MCKKTKMGKSLRSLQPVSFGFVPKASRSHASDSPPQDRRGDSVSHVERYKSPLSAMLVVSPPATMMC
jgi:hypothetical protein